LHRLHYGGPGRARRTRPGRLKAARRGIRRNCSSARKCPTIPTSIIRTSGERRTTNTCCGRALLGAGCFAMRCRPDFIRAALDGGAWPNTTRSRAASAAADGPAASRRRPPPSGTAQTAARPAANQRSEPMSGWLTALPAIVSPRHLHRRPREGDLHARC